MKNYVSSNVKQPAVIEKRILKPVEQDARHGEKRTVVIQRGGIGRTFRKPERLIAPSATG